MKMRKKKKGLYHQSDQFQCKKGKAVQNENAQKKKKEVDVNGSN